MEFDEFISAAQKACQGKTLNPHEYFLGYEFENSNEAQQANSDILKAVKGAGRSAPVVEVTFVEERRVLLIRTSDNSPRGLVASRLRRPPDFQVKIKNIDRSV